MSLLTICSCTSWFDAAYPMDRLRGDSADVSEFRHPGRISNGAECIHHSLRPSYFIFYRRVVQLSVSCRLHPPTRPPLRLNHSKSWPKRNPHRRFGPSRITRKSRNGSTSTRRKTQSSGHPKSTNQAVKIIPLIAPLSHAFKKVDDRYLLKVFDAGARLVVPPKEDAGSLMCKKVGCVDGDCWNCVRVWSPATFAFE